MAKDEDYLTVHLVLSLSVGGLNPDLDMRKRALMGCRSNMGGWSSAISMAVIPTAQMSHRWLYPPFRSTAATSGAILEEKKIYSVRELPISVKL